MFVQFSLFCKPFIAFPTNMRLFTIVSESYISEKILCCIPYKYEVIKMRFKILIQKNFQQTFLLHTEQS